MAIVEYRVMSSSTRVSHPAREYNMGAIWATATFLLLLVLMTWYAGGVVPVADDKLLVFLGWLHTVPLGGLALHRRLG